MPAGAAFAALSLRRADLQRPSRRLSPPSGRPSLWP